ncbi:MAG: hypothetical protein N3A66_10670, partial [Planctomycetota bacterium]|nr:hypothetical protein [Planctomycetota bacterium]
LILLALIGLCTVHEAMKQTRARYRLAEMLAEEERLRRDLAAIKAEVAALTDPGRLEDMARQSGRNFVPLLPMPELEPRPARMAVRAAHP